MQAENLNCPNCGAAVSSAAIECQFCESRLATVSCPSCFGMMFIGSKHCPRCGSAAARVAAADLPARNCPRCRLEMLAVEIGTTAVRECSRCSGLWLDVSSFERICADREQQAAVLGAASPAPTHSPGDVVSKVSYVPCPECSNLMNRINFARCSGVVVDICKGHGTWFDRDELTRIVEFIRGGGLDAARSKEKAQLEEVRRQLQVEQMAADTRRASVLGFDQDDHRIAGIASAGGLLKILLG
jgi:Zn-finger nucleic acid-binding protein